MQKYTNLSINDSMNSGESYSISWSTNSTALQYGYASFAQRFVNITMIAGAPSIDRVVWSWTAGDLSGYNESLLRLFYYNGSWQLLNKSPNAHTLSMTNLSSNGIYGIMEINSALNITLNAPANNSISNLSSKSFNFTAIDYLYPTMNCSIFLDNSLNQTNTVTNNTATIFPITNIPDGYHPWYVQCNDSANNIGTSVTRNFTVDTHPPSVAPNSPANLSIFNASN